MPENATILADKLVIKMKEEIKVNPVLAPGIFMNYYYQTYSKFNFIQHKQRRKFFVWMELHGKYEDESLIQEVMAALPLKVENTLINYRKSLIRKVPSSLYDFDPTKILSTMPQGKDIVVLDSSKDLPPNSGEMPISVGCWKTFKPMVEKMEYLERIILLITSLLQDHLLQGTLQALKPPWRKNWSRVDQQWQEYWFSPL